MKNNTTSSSSAIRFLGFVNSPEPANDGDGGSEFELDESDVIWSSSASDFYDSSDLTDPVSPESSTHSNSPSLRRHHYHPEKFGLSAALSDEHRPLVQRKPSLNPSMSAASAARTIPPVPIPRSGWSSDEFSNNSSSSGKYNQSAPVNVPMWRTTTNGSHNKSRNFGYFDDEEEDDGKDEEMLPPHEIVARSHVTTFSVFEGVGRTLKGRDLRRVRNAVWQKTGFLD